MQLLDTAKAMIVEDGLQRFTMESLTRTAGVSSPLVYKYFSSREELLQQLLKREFNLFAENLAAELQDKESFEDIARIYIRLNFDHNSPGFLLPILLSQPEISGFVEEELSAKREYFNDYLIRKTQEEFKLSKSKARLVVRFSAGVSVAAAEHYSLGKIGQKRAIDSAFTFIKAGIQQIADSEKD